jgi:hypothetical protein
MVDEPAATPASPPRWDRIAVLNNEAEAERLDVELNNRRVPHAMSSFADSALDGLYQLGHGWGQVEAPSDCRITVLDILHDIRESGSETADEKS